MKTKILLIIRWIDTNANDEKFLVFYKNRICEYWIDSEPQTVKNFMTWAASAGRFIENETTTLYYKD